MPDNAPVTIVIFGASGDLTARKLIPALFDNYRKERLPSAFRIVGFARTPFDDDAFRAHLGETQFAGADFDRASWDAFAAHLSYFPGAYDRAEDYARLDAILGEMEEEGDGRIYYLATGPDVFPVIAEQLGGAGMADETRGYRRIVVEKPYGSDLASAQALDATIRASFAENQIYRIDHYLGKETAQNILFFRFANTIFEPVWNREYIDNIQITVDEKVDVGRRGPYYDHAGVLRDMFQNHLLQLLTLVTMEPPSSFQADAVRDEKMRLLSAIQPIPVADTMRGQYDGYRDTKGVAPDSPTATYAALKLNIDNKRWRGVPIYLRSGKALARKASEIIIEFRFPSNPIFARQTFAPNLLSFCIQPDEGVHIKFEAKVPDQALHTRPVDMEFRYQDYYPGVALPDAYERLLLDVILGDASLFPRHDAIEASWRLIDPILAGWDSPDAPPLSPYEPGSWGPISVHELPLRDGRAWRIGCNCGSEDIECD